jgi:hypothetical protein
MESTMGYMLMILEPRGQRRARSPEEGQAAWDSMVRFGSDLKARGLLLAGESLRQDDQGTRIQVRGGKSTLLDGPFAEAKEMIGGFFLLDCETKEQALAIARACPAAQWATVEVRETGPCFL